MTLKPVSEALNFPYVDDNNWLNLKSIGTTQYPSPLEVKMLIETDRAQTLKAIGGVIEGEKYDQPLLGTPEQSCQIMEAVNTTLQDLQTKLKELFSTN